VSITKVTCSLPIASAYRLLRHDTSSRAATSRILDAVSYGRLMETSSDVQVSHGRRAHGGSA